MKEGFYFLEHIKYGVVLYEFRNGILSYYYDTVDWEENHKIIRYKFKEYGWFLSKLKNRSDLVYLEDL